MEKSFDSPFFLFGFSIKKSYNSHKKKVLGTSFEILYTYYVARF